MKTHISLLLVICLLACQSKPDGSSTNALPSVIPGPSTIEDLSKELFKSQQSISYFTTADDLESSIKNFASFLEPKGVNLIRTNEQEKASLSLVERSGLEAATYELEVSDKISIQASDKEGFFYALQSLKQLIAHSATRGSIELPKVKIKDGPNLEYRGVHLDVSRHFFSIDYVKRFVDLLSQYKINYLHWHLTDDQGWRIESKKYPKLHEVGGFRSETLIGHINDKPHKFDGKKYGGFYTQNEIRELVAYASERFITVVPEIDLPGHCSAILAAYPEYGCEKKPTKVESTWGIFDEVLCPYPETFEFLEDIMNEVMDLFPGPYIHLGGDEVVKDKWEESAFCRQFKRQKGLKNTKEIEGYFFNELARMVLARGKTPVGWDEIADFDFINKEAVVMVWRSEESAKKAISKGHKVILCPSSHFYFDYYQSMHEKEPLAIGGYLPLSKVYEHPGVANYSAIEKESILGLQGNLWTEYIPTAEKLEYMAFPRVMALAEQAWKKPSEKNYSAFLEKLPHHFKSLDEQGFNYSKSHFIPTPMVSGDGNVLLEFLNVAPGSEVRYELDKMPTATSQIAGESISILESATINAQTFQDGTPLGFPVSIDIGLHKWSGAKVKLTNPPSPKYEASGPSSFVNGVKGSNDRYGDSEWLGFDATDFEATVDLPKKEQIDSLTVRYFYGAPQWIFPPKSIEVWQSTDGGETYNSLAKVDVPTPEGKVGELTIPIKGEASDTWKIKVENFGIIPAGFQGAGHKAFLFVDEIIAK